MIDKSEKSFKEEDTLRPDTSFGSDAGRGRFPNDEETIVASIACILFITGEFINKEKLIREQERLERAKDRDLILKICNRFLTFGYILLIVISSLYVLSRYNIVETYLRDGINIEEPYFTFSLFSYGWTKDPNPQLK